MLEAFLVPLLWVLGAGLGLVVVLTVGFLVYCWLRSLAAPEPEPPDGEDG